MKRLFIFALVATLFVACSTDTTQDLAPEIPVAPDELYVSFDEEDTRVQLGENGAPVWNDGDLVSVFYRSNAHDKYEFTGETGDTDGTLRCVKRGTPTIGLDKVVAVYPYNENYLIELLTGNIQAFLPAEQTYAEDSYGIGSSIMISSSRTDRVYLKNVCGWLKLQLTGSGVVRRIVLRGNNGEQVAGNIYITADDASCTLASDLDGTNGEGSGDLTGSLIGTNTILTEVALDCGNGVELGAEPTEFYIALPPQTFDNGVTATVYGYVYEEEISTENIITIGRNHILPMAKLEIVIPNTPSTTPASNEIWYTATEKVWPYNSYIDIFGANITSNVFNVAAQNGIITFDREVTMIGDKAFYDRSSLINITIPDSVTTIGEYAFCGCSSLTSVTIPDSVTTIGNQAFSYCKALTSVIIGNSVTMIGRQAFYDCSKLTSVTIPDSVTTIGNSAFLDCYSLKEVYCKPTTPPSLGNSYVFDSNASDRKIYVPAASVDAYKAATNWSDYADVITAYDFENDCIVDVQPSNEIWYTSSDGNVVEPYKTDVFGANIVSNTYKNGVGVITFDGDITTIGEGAFRSCKSLTSVTIGNSVTTIGNDAFCSCSKLTAFYGKFASKDNRYLIVDGVLNSFAPAGLTTYSIPNSVTTIGDHAFFNGYALTSITIPNSVTTIGNYAFEYCYSLTSVTIGNSVTTIGHRAFYYCSKLKEVYCKPITPPSLDGSYVFDDNASGRKIYVPTASVDAYKAATYWSEYASAIEPYEF